MPALDVLFCRNAQDIRRSFGDSIVEAEERLARNGRCARVPQVAWLSQTFVRRRASEPAS